MKGVFVLGKESIKNNIVGRKKFLVILSVIVAVVVCIALIYVKTMGGKESVGFKVVEEKSIPIEITEDVIPEYKTLERALACKVEDDVYVLVTRGEKPTSGFNVSIDRMSVEKEDGKRKLIVYALFEDPQKETPISQIITYPVSIAKTDLTYLPDTIELRIEY